MKTTMMSTCCLSVMIAVAVVAEPKPPNFLLVIADDLGHNDIGWGNNRTKTPVLDSFVADGIELMEFYTFKYCAPTRGATMTGRYPFHFGFYNNQDANDYGVPTNFTMLPATLKAEKNYRTHMIGKWHLGFRNETLTPTFRGYDTFLGYYHMGEDYYLHTQSAKGGCGTFLDFSNSTGTDIRPLTTKAGHVVMSCTNITKNVCRHAYQNPISNFTTADSPMCCARCAATPNCQGWNWQHPPSSTCYLSSALSDVNPNSTSCDTSDGRVEAPESTYSAMIFAAEAQRLMHRHIELYSDQPLFMYLPFQSVHSPDEVPSRFERMYDGIYTDPTRKTHQGMVSALDEALGNLTSTFKQLGLYENSFMIFFSDNGGPLGSANNYPLRGGKFTNWEGGTRVRSFVHSPLLPQSRRGVQQLGIIHAVDVYPTFAALANITLGSTGPVLMDGVNQLEMLWYGTASARSVVFYSPIVDTYNPEDCVVWGQSCGGGIRVGDYKVLIGYPGDARVVVEPNTDLGGSEQFQTVEPSGGGPGKDGCNYTTGRGCPCHHLNGGPCLFNVVLDPSESHNLAGDKQYTAVMTSMLKHFYEMSSTHVPPAGLTGSDLRADEALNCQQLSKLKAFEPYGPFIPWPHALPNNTLL
eukprot:m.158827 g.158827  ORF g.158827 m.158827 type:complete len:637 (+) comp31110_c0_seq1:223-2133(+)